MNVHENVGCSSKNIDCLDGITRVFLSKFVFIEYIFNMLEKLEKMFTWRTY